jgi:hypothetical protein
MACSAHGAGLRLEAGLCLDIGLGIGVQFVPTGGLAHPTRVTWSGSSLPVVAAPVTAQARRGGWVANTKTSKSDTEMRSAVYSGINGPCDLICNCYLLPVTCCLCQLTWRVSSGELRHSPSSEPEPTTASSQAKPSRMRHVWGASLPTGRPLEHRA